MSNLWFLDDPDWREAIESNNNASVVSVTAVGNNTADGANQPRVIANPSPAVAWISRPLAHTAGNLSKTFLMNVLGTTAPRGDTIGIFDIAIIGPEYDAPSGYGDDKLRHSLPVADKPTLTIGVKNLGTAISSTSYDKDPETVTLRPSTFSFFRRHSTAPRVFPCTIWRGNHAFTWPGQTRSGGFILQFAVTRPASPLNSILYIGRVMHGTRQVIGPRRYRDGAQTRYGNPAAPRVQGRYPNNRRQRNYRDLDVAWDLIDEDQLDQLIAVQESAGDTTPVGVMMGTPASLRYVRIASFDYSPQTIYYNAQMRLQEIVQADIQSQPIEDTT